MSNLLAAARVGTRVSIALASAGLILGSLHSSTAFVETPGRRELPFDTPVQPFIVVRLVDLPARPWEPGHRGLDLAAALGDPVEAPAGGVVTFAGTVVNRGVVSINHPGGLTSSFEPVAPAVDVGQRVVGGDIIGTVSSEAGHCGATVCLHWGVRQTGVYVNPLDFLTGFGPIRLLPLGSN